MGARDQEDQGDVAEAAEAAAAARELTDRWERETAQREAEQRAVEEMGADVDRQVEEHVAAQAAEDERVAQERAERRRAEAEETARIRAQMAAQYPDLAAVSGSASGTSPGPAPF
ncbi:hypothetical protein OHA98_41470 [Streptomyces sp. NBC_00654]|uniref:hypothetical protein n=1 Tax=Streptomyces sp. NBC_00654 TaxID=2975799 RepID=UPI002252CFD6|nr:hypothetical protein [Streptomyces sp. NBC_00654]MCX4971084.1 hypothetical protein [Streptomyces sp. NBC_00654]